MVTNADATCLSCVLLALAAEMTPARAPLAVKLADDAKRLLAAPPSCALCHCGHRPGVHGRDYCTFCSECDGYTDDERADARRLRLVRGDR